MTTEKQAGLAGPGTRSESDIAVARFSTAQYEVLEAAPDHAPAGDHLPRDPDPEVLRKMAEELQQKIRDRKNDFGLFDTDVVPQEGDK